MSTPQQNLERRALSVQEAGRVCGVSRATIYRLIVANKLATIKIGSRRLGPNVSIDALLSEGASK